MRARNLRNPTPSIPAKGVKAPRSPNAHGSVWLFAPCSESQSTCLTCLKRSSPSDMREESKNPDNHRSGQLCRCTRNRSTPSRLSNVSANCGRRRTPRGECSTVEQMDARSGFAASVSVSAGVEVTYRSRRRRTRLRGLEPRPTYGTGLRPSWLGYSVGSVVCSAFASSRPSFAAMVSAQPDHRVRDVAFRSARSPSGHAAGASLLRRRAPVRSPVWLPDDWQTSSSARYGRRARHRPR